MIPDFTNADTVTKEVCPNMEFGTPPSPLKLSE